MVVSQTLSSFHVAAEGRLWGVRLMGRLLACNQEIGVQLPGAPLSFISGKASIHISMNDKRKALSPKQLDDDLRNLLEKHGLKVEGKIHLDSITHFLRNQVELKIVCKRM